MIGRVVSRVATSIPPLDGAPVSLPKFWDPYLYAHIVWPRATKFGKT